MRETWACLLVEKDCLENRKATHSSIFSWRSPRTEEPGGLQCMRSQRVGHNFRKGRGTRDQTANICWIMEKAREFQNIYFCFIDYAKAFDCVDHNKLQKILKEMGIPDPLTCLLRNLLEVRKQQLELDMEQQTRSK